ncbi:adenosine/AMP kinase [Bradyrhizobium sp. AZCC 1693]
MELTVVPIVKPDDANFIFGQSHFIKTVEDLHEALVGAVPRIRFGLAFCEASGKRLVRWSGNDEASLTLARNNALAIGAGHTFLIFLGDGFFPVNVLAAVRAVPEVCRIYCATANPTQVIVAQNGAGPRRARRGGWRLAAGCRNRHRHCVAEGPAAKDRLQAVVVG